MHIHFVCTGNTYRSRLAEAYLRSQNIPTIQVSSSGVQAFKDESGPIAWPTSRLMKIHKLTPYMSRDWTQTTSELVQKADKVIFMQEEIYKHTKKHFPSTTSYEVWNIHDIEYDHHAEFPCEEIVEISEETFSLIKKAVDNLVKNLPSKDSRLNRE